MHRVDSSCPTCTRKQLKSTHYLVTSTKIFRIKVQFTSKPCAGLIDTEFVVMTTNRQMISYYRLPE